MMIEDDRIFNVKNSNSIAYPIKDYYIDKFPLPFLGFYNTIIRATHSHHKHYFDVNQFK